MCPAMPCYQPSIVRLLAGRPQLRVRPLDDRQELDGSVGEGNPAPAIAAAPAVDPAVQARQDAAAPVQVLGGGLLVRSLGWQNVVRTGGGVGGAEMVPGTAPDPAPEFGVSPGRVVRSGEEATDCLRALASGTVATRESGNGAGADGCGRVSCCQPQRKGNEPSTAATCASTARRKA